MYTFWRILLSGCELIGLLMDNRTFRTDNKVLPSIRSTERAPKIAPPSVVSKIKNYLCMNVEYCNEVSLGILYSLK